VLLTERLLHALFTLVRIACLMQGLALLTALVGVPGVRGEGTEWIGTTIDGLVLAGAVLVATGIALVLAGRIEPRTGEEPPMRGKLWPAALAATLVVMPLVSLPPAGELALLWSHISALLEQAGFREELARGGSGSGLVMLPILVALLVPILESVTAFFLVVAPPLLLVSLARRSAYFPRLFAMLVATQTGLAICSFAAAGTLSTLVTQVMSSMQASGDAEVLRAAEFAAQLLGLIDRAARGFALPVLGHFVWLPFLLLSAAPKRFFAAGAAPHPTA
jgi:hypothetical protein